MNIYDARKLQKRLYKRVKSPNRYMICTIENGDLYYHNVFRISNMPFRIIDDDFIKTLLESNNINDVKVVVFVKDENNIQGWPPGMYLAEIIKID